MKKYPSPARLFANENYFGCSPRAVAAVKKASGDIATYPSAPVQLEKMLAKKFNLHPGNIVAGGGSVRIIDGLVQTFTSPNEEILTSQRTFVAYAQLAAAHGRKCTELPLTRDFSIDLDAIIKSHHKKTRLIFISNPNNPTGTLIPQKKIEHLLQSVSPQTLVVLDEAYAEYVTAKQFPVSVSFLKSYPNLVILRTFSKIYGLAGLRIGYALCHKIISEKLKNNRIPFFFNSLSEQAALAALGDTEFLTKCANRNFREREKLYEFLVKNGYCTVPSHGNFVYLHFDSEMKKEKMYQRLMEAGLLVCNLAVFGQDRSLRLGVGDRKITERYMRVLAETNSR